MTVWWEHVIQTVCVGLWIGYVNIFWLGYWPWWSGWLHQHQWRWYEWCGKVNSLNIQRFKISPECFFFNDKVKFIPNHNVIIWIHFKHINYYIKHFHLNWPIQTLPTTLDAVNLQHITFSCTNVLFLGMH